MDLERIWQLFQAGGVVMYTLIFCSILVVAVTLERHWSYKEAESFRGGKTDFLSSLQEGRWLEPPATAGAFSSCCRMPIAGAAWRHLCNCKCLRMRRRR